MKSNIICFFTLVCITKDVPAEDHISYQSCAEFIQNFDTIYEGRDKDLYPRGNPMKVSTPSNVEFPSRYTFTEDSDGVKTWSGYVFHRETTSDYDSYCDSALSLFTGNSTSPGNVRDIAQNIDKFGLPGSCCRKQ